MTNCCTALLLFLLALAWCPATSRSADGDLASLCADRAGIERVYHAHRIGTPLLFEQAMPPSLVEALVRTDLKKEATLLRVYQMKIEDAVVEAELQRIDATTRAPAILAEIKAALSGDRRRIARGLARPIVVERALRTRFENDDALHAPQRLIAEQAHERLLKADPKSFAERHSLLKECREGEIQEQVRWELTPRPPATSPERSADEQERKFYFEDLPASLQAVLRAQLLQAGDVSAVIETPGAFQIYLTRERTEAALAVAVFTLRKRSYEEWLAAQPEP